MTAINIEFIGKKAREIGGTPYAVFKGNMFGGEATFNVLKKYKNDDAAQYSAWMIEATTPATHGTSDIGDTYISDVVPHLSLVEVDGRTPTQEEFAAIGKLRSVFESDGTSEVYTFTEIGLGASPTPTETPSGMTKTTFNLVDRTVS